jgi:hypothetical protein
MLDFLWKKTIKVSVLLVCRIQKSLEDFNCGLKVPKRPLKGRQRPFIMIYYDFVARLGWSAHAAKTPNQHALFVSTSKLSKSKQTLPFCCRTQYSSGLVHFLKQLPHF